MITTYREFLNETGVHMEDLMVKAAVVGLKFPSKAYVFKAYEASRSEVRSEESWSIEHYPATQWTAGGETIFNSDRRIKIDGPWWDEITTIVKAFSKEVEALYPAAKLKAERKAARLAAKQQKDNQDAIAAAIREKQERIMAAIKAAEEA